MKNFLIFLILLFAQKVFAQSEWMSITTSVSGREYQIRNLEKKDNQLYDVWVKKIDPPIKIKGKNGKYTYKSKYSINNWIVSCDTKEYQNITFVEYHSNGKILSEGGSTEDTYKFIPDSVAYGVYEYICSENN
ncbi:hypothetical protein [Chryseobacterium sp. OV279]|uniref:hypothetical protein n=1 Tax=Chryseobacterium sp. OV279 TaxID=1500285 RepID=UPI0009228EB5|nr:hypothetical protein [Chryseobacterium sp. OV279]SHG64880.1 hypothetical protein SAMN02787100_4420 [Chryseobacterium sp. OV279]